MAKWGEGDPRWIVEDRPDTINVNNWHWTEKKAYGWSRDKLTALFKGLEINDATMKAVIKDIPKMDGDASANNRKGKLIFFYEWVLEMEWEGRAAGSDVTVKGKVEVPNLSEENDIDEIDVNVTLVDPLSGNVAEKLKQMMRTKGEKIIREKLDDYVKSLKHDFSKGLILPTKGEQNSNTTTSKGMTGLNRSTTFKPVESKKVEGVKTSITSISLEEQFKCTADELYRAFTVQEMVSAFTQGAAQVNAVEGGTFCMFDTNVSGKFTKLDAPNTIHMQWRFKSWPADHYSDVILKLNQGDDMTKLTLEQAGVPEDDFERTKQGWKRYYFESMKRTFGFGASLTNDF